MKATCRGDALSGSQRLSRRKSAPEGSEESLFSLLLKIETRLISRVSDGSRQPAGRRQSSKAKAPKLSGRSKLSRYIE